MTEDRKLENDLVILGSRNLPGNNKEPGPAIACKFHEEIMNRSAYALQWIVPSRNIH